VSVRREVIRCTEPGCEVAVATGVVTDRTWVWEIDLHNSVTDALVLANGMGMGDFINAKVTHTVTDRVVKHSIA
jgi:hypothetical protein